MVMSMTGYGIDTFHLEGTSITVEIRSVNSRYLDFIPKIPRSLHDLEIDIKNRITNYFQRGRIELTITISGEYLTNKVLQVDDHLLEQYINKIEEVQHKYNIKSNVPLSVLTSNEDIFKIEEGHATTETLKPLLLHSIEKVVELVLTNRKSEGVFLAEDICNRVKKIESMLKSVEESQEKFHIHYRERIKERIEKYLQQSIDIEQTQLLHEIALLAEKGDITEELTRLFSHIHHFRKVIQNESPVGRKLDFITQEMHREINTIGAKSVDPKISEWIVTIKSELEKVKEQLQNVE